MGENMVEIINLRVDKKFKDRVTKAAKKWNAKQDVPVSDARAVSLFIRTVLAQRMKEMDM